jgi:uncharacterized protein YyaL (SSP411 family)
MYRTARKALLGKKVLLRMDADKAVAQNLPPALAETIPHLPALAKRRSFAVVCFDFACQPPVFDVEGLVNLLAARKLPAA